MSSSVRVNWPSAATQSQRTRRRRPTKHRHAVDKNAPPPLLPKKEKKGRQDVERPSCVSRASSAIINTDGCLMFNEEDTEATKNPPESRKHGRGRRRPRGRPRVTAARRGVWRRAKAAPKILRTLTMFTLRPFQLSGVFSSLLWRSGPRVFPFALAFLWYLLAFRH